MHSLVIITAMLLARGEPGPECQSLFKAMEYRFTGGKYHDQAFHYRLFDPRGDKSNGGDKQYPLIVWLHGLGESGKDNVAHLRWIDGLLMTAPWERERFPFFVLVVQCPSGDVTWSPSAESADDMCAVTAAILDQTLQECPIDRDRVTLTGVSKGAGGCWQFAIRHPEYFAGVAPLSGGAFAPTAEQIASLKQMPIWVFNCRVDHWSQIDPVRAMVQTLSEGGVKVHLSEIEEGGEMHDSWTAAFVDYDLRSWLLAQRRGDPSLRTKEIIAPARETVAFSRTFLRAMCEYFRDVLRRWDWIQAPQIVFFALVLAVIGRRMYKHVRIVRRKARRSARMNTGSSPEVLP